MTFQKRYIATPHDILAIRLTCKCSTSLSFTPTEKTNFPDKCPNCHTAWFLANDFTQQILEQLILGLSALRKRNEESVCKLEFEFNQPE